MLRQAGADQGPAPAWLPDDDLQTGEEIIMSEPTAALAEIILPLTDFQSGEVSYGLDIDAADFPDRESWGEVVPVHPRSKNWKLVIRPDQWARDQALYRITSLRDICLDNAGDRMTTGQERTRLASQGRSLDALAGRLITAAGGPEGFSADVRRWIHY